MTKFWPEAPCYSYAKKSSDQNFPISETDNECNSFFRIADSK